MKDLMKHIEVENAKTKAWVAEKPESRFATTWTTDESHWKEMGITTVEQFERNSLVENIWDLYKEINNIRPRHIDFDSMTIDELGIMEDELVNEMKTLV